MSKINSDIKLDKIFRKQEIWINIDFENYKKVPF